MIDVTHAAQVVGDQPDQTDHPDQCDSAKSGPAPVVSSKQKQQISTDASAVTAAAKP